MSMVSVDEAARLTGKSRAKLYKMMKTGELSFSVSTENRRILETSELMRVLGEFNGSVDSQETNSKTTEDSRRQENLKEIQEELNRANNKIAAKEREIELLTTNNQDLRNAMLRLQETPEKTVRDRQSSWWKRIFT